MFNYIDPQQLSRLIVHTPRDKILHLAISCTDAEESGLWTHEV